MSEFEELRPLMMSNEQRWKCLACITEFIEWEKTHPGEQDGSPEINDAVTLAPAWQSHTVTGQTLFACVMSPSCMRHLGVKELSPEERAIQGGIVLGRPGVEG